MIDRSGNAIFVWDNGDKITISVDGDYLKIRGSGSGIGKLTVEPEGSNMVAIRVIA